MSSTISMILFISTSFNASIQETSEEGEGRYLRGSSSYAAAKPRELTEGKKKEAKKVKKMKKLKDHVVKKKPATKKAKKINKKDGIVKVSYSKYVWHVIKSMLI